MKTADFIRTHNACPDGSRWASSVSPNMSAVWDALVNQGKHEWLLWTATRQGVFTESILRKLACRFVRETPLVDGRTVWDLLTDERSRKAIEVAEAYVDGKATDGDLADARSAARAAYDSARAARDARAARAARAARDARDARAARAARAAYYAARAAYAAVWAVWAAYDAARSAAWAARAAAYSADSAYSAAAKSAQIKMIAEIGNPFNKEAGP